MTRRAAVARALYATAWRLLAPAYAARLWWRGRSEPGYRQRLAERFGWYSDPPSAGWVWVHAVSLGETRAAGALVQALRRGAPGLRVLLTHGTATGRTAGVALLREGDAQAWLPLDSPGAVRRFFRHFRPRVGVLMETEIWPVLLHEAQRRGVPMVLANARLSPKSFRQGQRWAWLLRDAARSMALVLAQTPEDAQRLRDSGAPQVQVCGNLKFDLTPDAGQLALGAAWAGAVARPMVLAAVTREGEEAALLQAWGQRRHAQALLLIVPRHPQRFDEVAALVQAQGLSLARRSRWGDAPDAAARRASVWLGDSMGEMALYYACAAVAMLGGSFAPLGGQNLIEAAACGCPLVMGPSTYNFDEAAQRSLSAGAAQRVANWVEAVAAVDRLLDDPAQRAAQRAAALQFAQAHRGAAQASAQRILALLDGGGAGAVTAPATR